LTLLVALWCAGSAAAQTPVRLAQEARFTKLPGSATLGTLFPGAEVTPGKTSRSSVEVTIEAWVPTASLGPMSRDGFNVAIRKRPNETLHPSPGGPVIARVTPNVGFNTLESRGAWTRVKRVAWIDQKALQAPAGQQVDGPDRALVTGKGGLATVPGGPVIGSVDSGVYARMISRTSGWTRVQIEAWVPDSLLRATDNRVLVGVSQAEVRANPARYVGQMVEWRLQFVAVQRADELRPEIPEGQTYLLTRGPLPEPGFVYVVVPQSRVPMFESVPALKELTVRGTIRAASTKFLPTPVLDLVDVVSGLGS
jgi:hypothetical protein